MLDLLDGAAWLIAAAVALPCAVYCAQCVLGAASRARRVAPLPEGVRPRVAVLIPAHDERAGIGATLEPLRAQLAPSDTLLVVADNCTDDTIEVARAHGAMAIERRDPDRRGKGYALAFGLEQLAAAPPDVVVIVDADCQVAAGAIERLARLALRSERPVQADYVLTLPAAPQGVAVVSALAFIVKNRVRPRGMHLLGLPCMLTGTGMAFPWPVIRKAPPTEGNLVEDMVMGIDLALLDHPPLLCPDAFVTSALPDRTQAAHTQRRRWEHGHLATLIEHAPRLLARGVLRAKPSLIAMACDLAVPPLSLLVLCVLAALAGTLGANLLGASLLPFVVACMALAAIGLGTLAAWAAFGREVISAAQLLAIPRYVLWKLPLYLSFLVRGRHGTWERTDRGGRDSH
jgi:cellulose synthase/poly-beta-1,6-N-acetylglucosamine synthase-like glycosyltransferase